MSSPVIQAAIRLSNFYVTQLEFRIDGAERTKVENQDELNIELTHTVGLPQEQQQSFIVLFDLKLTDAKASSLSLALKAVAEFTTNQPVDEGFGTSPLVQINAPAIAFPFLRSYVHTVTMHSGAPGIILPAMNFKESKKEAIDPQSPNPSLPTD